MPMAKRYWRIKGYNSLDPIFDKTIPVGCITTSQLMELLKCLAAKEGLSYNEIIGGYVKRKTRLANIHLDVHKETTYPAYMCGTDPHFIAFVVDERGSRIKYAHFP
jgi:hypothetical protein